MEFLRPALFAKSLPVVGAVLGVAGSLPAVYYYTHQRELLYRGTDALPYFRKQCLNPSQLDIDASIWNDLTVTAPDGTLTRGYTFLQPAPEKCPTLLYFHGNGGNLGHYLVQTVPFFTEMKCNVIMGSYRGCGLSDGSPSEKGMREDAEATFQWIRQHPVLSKCEKLVLMGTSLGGAVAARVARDHPGEVDAVILENTFTSVIEAATDLKAAPPLIMRLLDTLTTERWEAVQDTSRFGEKLPVLFIASGKDRHVPAFHCRKLYEASSGLKTFVQFDEAYHMTTWQSPRYYTTLQRFLQNHFVLSPDATLVSESNVEKILERCVPIQLAFPDLPLEGKEEV